MFAILRTQKLRNISHLRAAAGHNDRSIPPAHAKPGQDTKPVSGFGPLKAAEVVGGVLARIPAQRRKDAVLAIEQVLTASPEYFTFGTKGGWNKSRLKVWANSALEWLKREHGENLVAVTLHLDETSPHLHAIITPLTPDGRLCAKEYTARKRLVDWQTSYAAAVASLGLQRGLRGSQATHSELKSFRRLIDAPVPPMPKRPAKPEIGPLERLTAAGKAKQEAYDQAVEAYRKQLAARQQAIEAKAKVTDRMQDADARAKRAAVAEEQARTERAAADRVVAQARAEHDAHQQAMQTMEKATLATCAKLINGMPRDQLAKALDIELRPGDVIDQLRRRGLVKDLREGVAFVSERIGGQDLAELAAWVDDYGSQPDPAPSAPTMGM
ncbi:MobV family relaxase [Burkholderia vietnamiensis]|uniref:MobV family relaxase n=1 Tax=Burkholderia vietnamiensis TaxID=60552 RepID=UPI0015934CB2|nr:MobV family relaxase [Burkholderia vietnamiensis]